MQRTRSQWRSIIFDRLSYVYDAVIRKDHCEVILEDLSSFELTSEFYDGNCLTVDVWYLFDRRAVFVHRRFTKIAVIQDPVIRVFFAVVVQALVDVKSRRPCDAYLWRLDHPPDQRQCSPTTHICEKKAVEFIKETSVMWEHVLNLSYGMLAKMVTQENGSLKSRSQDIFNCTGQESQ